MFGKVTCFAIGAIVGAVGGYFTAKYLIAEKLEKESNDKLAKRVAELEDFYKKRDESRQKAHELNELKEEFELKHIEKEQKKAESQPVDYTAPQRKKKNEEEDEWGDAKKPKGAPRRSVSMMTSDEIDYGGPEYDSEDGVKVYPTEPSTEPYYISEESFENDHFEYEKSTLLWFTQDNVVTDDEFQPLEDLALIGEDWMNHFGEENDPDVVHVRNSKIACDYEILRQNRSYASMGPDI